MSNIPKILKEYSRNLQQLVDEGEHLQGKMKALESQEKQTGEESVIFEYHAWHQRVINTFTPLLRAIQQETVADDIENCTPTLSNVVKIRGKMRGTYLDVEQGKLNHVTHSIQKENLEDLLVHTDELFKGEETNSHVLAAMLAGILLEKSIRTLCKREDIIPDDGKWQPLGKLLEILDNKQVFDNQRLIDQLNLWRNIRNDVSHGNYDTFSRSQVEGMIDGVKRFVKDYL